MLLYSVLLLPQVTTNTFNDNPIWKFNKKSCFYNFYIYWILPMNAVRYLKPWQLPAVESFEELFQFLQSSAAYVFNFEHLTPSLVELWRVWYKRQLLPIFCGLRTCFTFAQIWPMFLFNKSVWVTRHCRLQCFPAPRYIFMTPHIFVLRI